MGAAPAWAQPWGRPTATQQQQQLQRELDRQEARSNARDIRTLGDTGEQQVRVELRRQGYRIVGEQVRLRLPQGSSPYSGSLRIADFLVIDRQGRLIAFDAKVNDSSYSSAQSAKDRIIARQGATIENGESLRGLQIGQQVRFPTRVLRVTVELEVTVNGVPVVRIRIP